MACQFSAVKTGKALAERFLWMAPLRLAGGSVTALFNLCRNHQDCSAVLSSATVTAAEGRGLNGPRSDLWDRDRAAFRRPILGEDLLLGFL